MIDPKAAPTLDAVEPDAEEEGRSGQPGSKLYILGHSVGDAVGEVCAAGLDMAGSILGGIVDGL
ncbi:MAG: hypothetical protein O9322_08300 [Beijerinckiaceae bacterium]|nr:hypothetical protein [Beijerinckiaceae bacterium]MCZ8301113.1 hypothetical protein [Beijerinckiaceae bacterium]